MQRNGPANIYAHAPGVDGEVRRETDLGVAELGSRPRSGSNGGCMVAFARALFPSCWKQKALDYVVPKGGNGWAVFLTY